MNEPTKPKAGKDFLNHLRKPAPAVEARPLDEPREALPTPPAPPRQEFTAFSSRISIENDLMLERVKHWVREPEQPSKQEILNNALREYLLKFPEALKPTPKELRNL
jgi:hypothetical protein